jgi:hypothetical protein
MSKLSRDRLVAFAIITLLFAIAYGIYSSYTPTHIDPTTHIA